MSRGVVLWPDEQTSHQLRSIWDQLVDQDLPSMATESHRLHVPHVSLIVADDLQVADALAAVGAVPSTPIPLLIEAAALVPGGHLLLACTANRTLLEEQARVHRAALPHAQNAWSHYAPDEWLPHLTTARSLTVPQVSEALRIVLDHLPIRGSLTAGGIEDGATGESWRAVAPEAG